MSLITILANITTIASATKSIIELVEKTFSNPESKKENFAEIEKLCQQALEENPQTRILTPEEEKAIRNYVEGR